MTYAVSAYATTPYAGIEPGAMLSAQPLMQAAETGSMTVDIRMSAAYSMQPAQSSSFIADINLSAAAIVHPSQISFLDNLGAVLQSSALMTPVMLSSLTSQLLTYDPNYAVTYQPTSSWIPLTFSIKPAEATVAVAFDFSLALLSGETFYQPEVMQISQVGADQTGSVLQGAPSVDPADPTRVLQETTGGVNATDYQLEAVILTSFGRRLAASAILPVRN